MNQKRSQRAAPPVAAGKKRSQPYLRLLCQQQQRDCLRPGRVLGTMPEEEADKYLGLLKKALSGALGKI